MYHNNYYGWQIFHQYMNKEIHIFPIVQLVIVNCNNRTTETITLIKSALIFSNCSNINFHIFVDNISDVEMSQAVNTFINLKLNNQTFNFEKFII
jgi:hypothetical protein